MRKPIFRPPNLKRVGPACRGMAVGVNGLHLMRD